MARRLKHLPAMQETWVQSLGREVPLEKEMETHSSILAWRIPWTEEPGGLQSMGSQRVGLLWREKHIQHCLQDNPTINFQEKLFLNNNNNKTHKTHKERQLL